VNLFMQSRLGFSAFRSGLGMMPFAGAVMLAGQLAPRIMGRLPHRRSMVIGLGFYVTGMTLIGLFIRSGGYWQDLGPWLMILAFGSTLSFMAMMAEATADVPEDQQGVASAVLFTIQQIGTPLGATLALSILTGGGGDFRAAFLAMAAVVGAGLILSLVALRRTPATTTAEGQAIAAA
jgi:predicted MFS family arabinose efflux permease